MNDDGFGDRGVPARPDVGKLDDLSCEAADGIDLGIQHVDLVLHLFLHLLHIPLLLLQFRHESGLFSIQLSLDTL